MSARILYLQLLYGSVSQGLETTFQIHEFDWLESILKSILNIEILKIRGRFFKILKVFSI